MQAKTRDDTQTVYVYDEMARLLGVEVIPPIYGKQKDLPPAKFLTNARKLYNGTKFKNVWKQSAGTYRGELYNVKNPLSDIVHISKNILHDTNLHYNIIFGDGTKAGIIIIP